MSIVRAITVCRNSLLTMVANKEPAIVPEDKGATAKSEKDSDSIKYEG